jgi:hypothetical protein
LVLNLNYNKNKFTLTDESALTLNRGLKETRFTLQPISILSFQTVKYITLIEQHLRLIHSYFFGLITGSSKERNLSKDPVRLALFKELEDNNIEKSSSKIYKTCGTATQSLCEASGRNSLYALQNYIWLVVQLERRKNRMKASTL